MSDIKIYKSALQFYKQLPPDPEKVYNDFTNISHEGGFLMKRYRPIRR